MLKFVCLAVLVGVAAAAEIQFKDCGKGEVKKVDISGTTCSGYTCQFTPGKVVKLAAEFTANQDTKSVGVKFVNHLNGLEVPVPGVDADGCKHINSCPLTKGQTYSYSYDFKVPALLPKGNYMVNAEFTGEHGSLACVQIHSEVKV